MRRPEPQRVREGSAGLEKIQRAETGLRPQTLGTCESGLFTHVKLLLVSVLSQQQLNSALGSDGVNHHPEQLIKTFSERLCAELHDCHQLLCLADGTS